MPRYIDAEKIEYSDFKGDARKFTIESIAYRRQIDSIPTADVEPVIHAHWIRRIRDHRNDYYDVMDYPYRCSACRERSKELTKRCPECGANMDEEVKDDA